MPSCKSPHFFFVSKFTMNKKKYFRFGIDVSANEKTNGKTNGVSNGDTHENEEKPKNSGESKCCTIT